MPNHDTIFKVVVNHEEQYAIWPDDKLVPDGWRAAGVGNPGRLSRMDQRQLDRHAAIERRVALSA